MDSSHYISTLSEIQQTSDGTDLIKDFLENYPKDFIDTLRSWIQFGEKRCDMCMLMIYMIKYEEKDYLFYMPSEQSLLHLAATFHDCQVLVKTILEFAPTLAGHTRLGPHAGLTPLHIIVSKGDYEATQSYLTSLTYPYVKQSLNELATGTRFHGTHLMGQTALSAAVLRFLPQDISTDTLDALHLAGLLLDEGAAFDDRNSLGDTVIHTLIRYAHLYPERREQVLEMMAEIQSHLLTPVRDQRREWGRLYARRVWFCQNKNQMTPLQLAATLGEHEIVCFIVELQWVYRTLHDYDGIFETNKYDITEIDTLAKIEWCKNQEKNISQILHEREPLCKRLKRFFLCHDSVVARKSTPAILEVICEVDVEAACNIISTPVVKKLITAKWRKYKAWFYSWALMYIICMIFLSIYASLKFRYVHYLKDQDIVNSNQTSNDSLQDNMTVHRVQRVKFVPDPMDRPSKLQEVIVDIGCVLALFISVFSLYLEFVRTFVQQKSWNLLLVHHNGSYRLLLLLNALALGVDSVWFLISPATNNKTPMVLALLFGWWFSTFFLRPFKKFSFFTVMLMKVILGDMLRFFTIIIIALVSFTMAMHLLFLHSDGLPKEFESVPLACLTMFKLMLGLTDLEILEQADPVWLALVLFVIYILLTYVLLINSLIAMMSNTCSEIAGQKGNQWMIQRLSVILFVENMMLCGFVRTSGSKNYFRKNNEGNELEARYVIEDTKLTKPNKGGHHGHDIQAKDHYVASATYGARNSLSSVEDLWGPSDLLSQTSKGSKDAESNVSLAESFVVQVGKKYRQASRRSRSSMGRADNSDASQTSLNAPRKPKGLMHLLRRLTRIKRARSTEAKNMESDSSDLDNSEDLPPLFPKAPSSPELNSRQRMLMPETSTQVQSILKKPNLLQSETSSKTSSQSTLNQNNENGTKATETVTAGQRLNLYGSRETSSESLNAKHFDGGISNSCKATVTSNGSSGFTARSNMYDGSSGFTARSNMYDGSSGFTARSNMYDGSSGFTAHSNMYDGSSGFTARSNMYDGSLGFTRPGNRDDELEDRIASRDGNSEALASLRHEPMNQLDFLLSDLLNNAESPTSGHKDKEITETAGYKREDDDLISRSLTSRQTDKIDSESLRSVSTDEVAARHATHSETIEMSSRDEVLMSIQSTPCVLMESRTTEPRRYEEILMESRATEPSRSEEMVMRSRATEPRRREEIHMESRATEPGEGISSARRLSQDSSLNFKFIDEGLDGEEETHLLENVAIEYGKECGEISTLKSNDIEVTYTSAVPISKEECDTKIEAESEKMVGENGGETFKSERRARRERDPRWADLLKSIRSLDRDKRSRRGERKKSTSSPSSSDLKQRRNAFIKGLGSSYDYGHVLEADEYI